MFDKTTFWEMPLVVIMRGFPLDTVTPIVQAIERGGLCTLEITMNTPRATDQIRAAVQAAAGGRMQIGAGTVTTPERFEKAIEAGASFIVTPNLNADVIQLCRQHAIPFIPGAWTPTEIYQAHEWGALAVKIFPANTHGPDFVRAIKAPFPQIKLAPTGGVTVERMRGYLAVGADAFGLGSPLFPQEAVQSRDWMAVEQAARSFATAYTDEKQRVSKHKE